MFKSLFIAMFAVTTANAANLVLAANVTTTLPSCGGTVHTQKTPAGQVNVSFKGVQNCSNFDILSKDFGILDIEYKNRKIPQDATGARSGSFTVPQAYIQRGINSIRLEVRSNGGAHKDIIDLVFVEGPVAPPVSPTSLKGFCADTTYTNFQAAKAFAYATNGLNYSDSNATNFALDYNKTHRCGTIAEYKARFEELKSYAYATNFMNLSDSASRDFALSHVETTLASTVRAWKAEYPVVHEFFYGTNYMNLSASVSSQKTDTFVRRGYCGDATKVSFLKSEFRRHYTFAYSTTGLNLSASKAVDFAVTQVKALTPCSDLIAR